MEKLWLYPGATVRYYGTGHLARRTSPAVVVSINKDVRPVPTVTLRTEHGNQFDLPVQRLQIPGTRK